jgi:uncharacterized protein YlzI (FlbEa/FlbD family)
MRLAAMEPGEFLTGSYNPATRIVRFNRLPFFSSKLEIFMTKAPDPGTGWTVQMSGTWEWEWEQQQGSFSYLPPVRLRANDEFKIVVDGMIEYVCRVVSIAITGPEYFCEFKVIETMEPAGYTENPDGTITLLRNGNLPVITETRYDPEALRPLSMANSRLLERYLETKKPKKQKRGRRKEKKVEPERRARRFDWD